jgi:hypothetical protein
MRITRSMLRTARSVAAALTLLAAGCASQPQGPDVINVNGLIPITGTRLPNVRAYEAPGFEVDQYHGMLIEPATVYRGSDADFDDVAEADRVRIAALLTSEFKRVLGAQLHVVDHAAPGVVRIDLALIGINPSKPVLSTALRLTPVGLVISAAHGVQSKPAAFTGSINMAAVAYDSQSGAVLAAVQAIIAPSAVDLTSGITPLRAAELSTTRAAEAFRDYIKRAKGLQ